MILPYRRHTHECKTALRIKNFSESDIRVYKRCDCPVWMKGADKNNDYVRESCDTRDWATGERKAIERYRQQKQEKGRVPIEAAQKRWLDEKIKKSRTTQKMYKLATTRLIESSDVRFLDELTGDHVLSLRNRWREEGKRSRTINLYRTCLGTWFRYLIQQGWMTINLMDRLPHEDIEEDEEPTLPLDDQGDRNWRRIEDEVVPFLKQWKTVYTHGLPKYPDSFKALLEILYHTGLRISDAVQLKPSEIEKTDFGGSWTLRQQKTRNRVTVFLEPWLLERLQALPSLSPEGHVFYDGVNWESYINHHIRKPLRALGKHLGFAQCLRPHRFRDSFAVNALNDGVSLDDLKDLLGHKSIKTTEQHYLKYTKNRQNALERRLYGVRTATRAAENVVSIAARVA